MALSNIAREPQREITESVIGVLALATAGFAWWWVSDIFALATWDPAHLNRDSKLEVCPYWLWDVLWMATTLAALFPTILVGMGLVFLAHSVGEGVCARLRDLGLDPRPKLRRIDRTDFRTGEKVIVWREE